MSSYPKRVQGGGYECQACYGVWEDPVDAKDCCPPCHILQAWDCGTGKDWCHSGLHFTEEEARQCMEQAASDD